MQKTIYSKEYRFIVEKLKKARKEAGLEQAEVAKKIDRTQSYVSKVEAGQSRVDLIQLKEFARIYKKNITHFIPKS